MRIGRSTSDTPPPAGVISKLRVVWASNDTVTITCDMICLSDGSTTKLFNTVSETPNITSAVGAGGPDASGLDAINSWIAIWLIGKSDGTIDGLFSASSTSPTMPSGYTFKRRVGWVRNDASSNFVKFVQDANEVDIVPQTAVLSGGTSTTFVAVDCTSATPSTSYKIRTKTTLNGTSGVVSFTSRRDSSLPIPGTDILQYDATSIASILRSPLDIRISSQSFDYLVTGTGASATVTILGWYDQI